jgi:integrase
MARPINSPCRPVSCFTCTLTRIDHPMTSKLRQARFLMPFAAAYLKSAAIAPHPAKQLARVVDRLPEILGNDAPLIQDAVGQYDGIEAWVDANRSQISGDKILATLRTMLREGERQGLCELPDELRRFRALPIPIVQPKDAERMLLTDALAQYLALKELSARSIENYTLSVNVYERWNADALTLDVACERLNKFIAWLQTKYSPHSAKTHRRHVLTILKSAERDGLCVLPKRIRTVVVPQLDPKGFTASELTALMKHADPYQKAFISLAFDTGLRHSDLERMDWADVDEENLIIRLVQKKTRRVHSAPISPETLNLCHKLKDPIMGGSGLLIPLPYCRRHFYKLWRDLGKRAGIDLKRRSLQAVRRTAATLIARERGEYAAATFLGHAASSGVVVYASNYRVSNVLPQRPPAPNRSFGFDAENPELAESAAG